MEQRIIELITQYTDIPIENVNQNSLLREDLGLDSLDLAEILFAVESLFGVSVQDDLLADCRAVGDIAKVLKNEFPSLVAVLEKRDQRSAPRRILHLPVTYSTMENRSSSYSLDFSASGIRLVSRKHQQPGSSVQLEVGGGGIRSPLKISGRVVDSRAFSYSGAKLHRLGIVLEHEDHLKQETSSFLNSVSNLDDTTFPDSLVTGGLGRVLLSFRKTIYLQETNLMGNVYFANYFAWQGAAREEFMRHLLSPEMGLSEYKMVTTFAAIKFLRELTLFDEILIHVYLSRADRFRMELLFHFHFQDALRQEPVATGKQTVAFVKADGKMAAIPDVLRTTFFAKYLEPDLE